MKMGTIASPRRYDVVRRDAAESEKLRYCFRHNRRITSGSRSIASYTSAPAHRASFDVAPYCRLFSN